MTASFKNPTRRELLQTGLLCAAMLPAAPAILRAEAAFKKTLRMQSLNSGEKLTVTYWAEGKYIDGARKEIDRFMRDLRTGESTKMDVRLLDLLWEIDRLTPSSDPIYTMSGYRSPSTNATLASTTDGVDPSSFHMRGMALDVTQDFRDPEMIFKVANKLARGGAGYYPTSHPYVHLDVGPVDSWVYPAHGRADRAAEYDRLQAAGKKG